MILGAGVTGLAAGSVLSGRSVVLERDVSPGGLVRCDRIGPYWFDRVLHLLYFQDAGTQSRISSLLGEVLAPCPAQAFVETSAGTCRFPIQMHLSGLDPDVRAKCLEEMACIAFGATGPRPVSIEDNFLSAFGPTLCKLFMLPYNRKMWKRPLRSIAHEGLSWNVERPDFGEVLRGALEPARSGTAYNSKGNYPRPPADAPVRGMEVVSRALAQLVPDLRLGCEVTRVDCETREVAYRCGPNAGHVRWTEGMLSTIPLPRLAALCPQVPQGLRERIASLRCNRVVSVFVAVEGPRPEGTGLWRYYADETICFSRLVFMHEFDPLMAPPEGWGLLAEITQCAEDPIPSMDDLCAQVVADAARVSVLRTTDRVVGMHAKVVNPAYVVLADGDRKTIEDAICFFESRGVACRGRYGAWKYSGMSQCMREGFEWADAAVTRSWTGTPC